jgi:hypothetical protein
MAATARKTADNAQIFVAKQSFSAEVDGVPVIVSAGVTRVRAGHALLAGREALFEPITVHYDVADEQSQVRGETRG